MIRGTIDSIDEGIARIALDGGAVFSLPASALPPGAREGDRLRLELTIDKADTEDARARIAAKRRALSRE